MSNQANNEPVNSLRWGIVGTGESAEAFARALSMHHEAELVGVVDPSESAVMAFARRHEIPLAEVSLAEMLAFPELDAVYLATPVSSHLEYGVEALRAGKHVLCEKPLGMSVREIELMTAAARRANRCLMEATHFRVHPQTLKLLEMIREGKIGTPKVVQAAYSIRAEVDPGDPIFNLRMGGGGVLVSGCLPMSFARLVAGVAYGNKPYLDPLSMVGYGIRGETGVDEYASAVALFPGDLIAEISCGIRLDRQDRAAVIGEEGTLVITSPWIHKAEGGVSFLEWIRPDRSSEVIDVHCPSGSLALEAAEVARCHALGLRESPNILWDDSTGNAKSLEMWLETIPTAKVSRQGTERRG